METPAKRNCIFRTYPVTATQQQLSAKRLLVGCYFSLYFQLCLERKQKIKDIFNVDGALGEKFLFISLPREVEKMAAASQWVPSPLDII